MIIREKDRKTLLQIFSQVNQPFEVWAYGSRVNGTAHEGSDLDLVIRGAHLTPVSKNIFNTLFKKIQNSNIPILVEFKDWALIPKSFHHTIQQQHEVLFDNRKDFHKQLLMR